MKTTIQKLNQFLLKRYPIMWNTKIFSIVGISLVVHLLFFIIGYNNHDDLERYSNNRFGVGLVFFNIIVSILILLYWVISLSKNNAFKDYYPTSANKLFVHFTHYFVIIFFATTFYISHQIGITTYVRVKISKTELEKEIEQVNKGAIFLSHSKSKYTGYVKEDEISYYNYDDYFINSFGASRYYEYDGYNKENYVTNLLDSANSKEKITKILTDFLAVAKKYKVKTNLTVQKWLNVVYSGKNTSFGINQLISRNYNDEDNYYEYEEEDEIAFQDGCIEPDDSYKSSQGLYLVSHELKDSINSKKYLFRHNIPNFLQFFVWFCLFLTVIIFVIRVTSLRLFLLSLVSVALLSLFVYLFLLMSKSNGGSVKVEDLIVVVFASLVLILVPYFLLNKKSDSLSGILINISLPAFPLFLLSLVVYSNRRLQEEEFHLVSGVIFILTIVYIYTRCYMFRKWKGLPEG